MLSLSLRVRAGSTLLLYLTWIVLWKINWNTFQYSKIERFYVKLCLKFLLKYQFWKHWHHKKSCHLDREIIFLLLTLRINDLLSRAPGGWLDSNLKTEPSSHCQTGGLSCKLHFREKPTLKWYLNYTTCLLHWTLCLHYVPAAWANPYKALPWITFQLIGVRYSLANWICTAISSLVSSPAKQNNSVLTNQMSTFWTNKTENLEPSFA